MKKFEVRAYGINDFKEWDERGQLEIAPKFQRRNVWLPAAKSYLIDTIIRGKPIPKIYIRTRLDPETKKSIREVVDGQQRLRAILEFIKDGFKISKVHNTELGNKSFSELPQEVQNEILKYELSVDLLNDASDAEVLDIFARLNTYTVTLNQQELINAKFFGHFKQTVYRVGFEYNTFWKSMGVLNDRQILRMEDAALTSELFVAMLDGIQSKKAYESYYKTYDDAFANKERYIDEYKRIMDLIGRIYGKELPTSNFTRLPMFYTLFIVLYDLVFGLPNTTTKRHKIAESDYPKIRATIEEIDSIWNDVSSQEKHKTFFDAASKATSDEKQRKIRHSFILKRIIERLQA